MDYGLQFPLLCDKEDEGLRSYLGQDCFLNDFQSADVLSPTFAGDDYVDLLVRQLESQPDPTMLTTTTVVDQSKSIIDQRLENNAMFTLTDHDGFMKFLDELDIDTIENGGSDDQSNNGNSGTESGEEMPPTSTTGMTGTFVDEHDYARGYPVNGSSTSPYSMVEEDCSESESNSPFAYERQITSNSSSSSATMDFSVPRSAAWKKDIVLDVSDSESQPPAFKQRRSNFVLPAAKPVKSSSNNQPRRKYPPLMLSEEERQLCEKERIFLPDHYPLTKDEERKLRGIRRKIRNKASAQLSRKKKQEYIEALEHRATECSEENEALKRTVKMLSSQNGKLQSQLRKLHASFASTDRRSAQTGTCLAVLLLSFALLIAPEYSPFGKRSLKNQSSEPAVVNEPTPAITPGNTRTLLQWQGLLELDTKRYRDEDNYSTAEMNRYFYDNESIEMDPNHSGDGKKRKHFLMAPDAQPNYQYETDGDQFEYSTPKRTKFSDPMVGANYHIDLDDIYKTPGISNESREIVDVYQQPYEMIGRPLRTEDM